MTSPHRRVALFSDSFHEVNGVGLTCRMFEDFAFRHGHPLLSIRTGPRFSLETRGSVTACEIPIGPLSLPLEQDLRFDLLFPRHLAPLRRVLEQFQPDLLHITGPNHPGLLGALLAWRLHLPLAASWHTNVHQYAGRRLPSFLPKACARAAESAALALTLRLYSLAQLLFAPNPELSSLLSSRTGHPCRLPRRGVDCTAFSPLHRQRTDSTLVIGYVGRLSPEKNVRELATLEHSLRAAGLHDFRFEIAGHGAERAWLHANLSRLHDHGTLRGPALARAYSNFDIFVFPSETDTYGNVVQEAMASGVPCVVTAHGGPAHIVSHGRDGLVAETPRTFRDSVVALSLDPSLRRRLALAASHTALSASWDAVFHSVYEAYGQLFPPARSLSPTLAPGVSAWPLRETP